MERRFSKSVKVGNTEIGDKSPISIQSMCNTHTCDVEASLAQCRSLYHCGAQIIRLTTPTLEDVTALGQIRLRLESEGIFVPIVADVHFSSHIAFEAARIAHKVRINPGNFSHNANKMEEDMDTLLDICRHSGTALRIGVNQGSLSENILQQYGNTARGMAEGAMQYLRLCHSRNFEDVVVSIKSSNTKVMTQAYRLLVALMDSEDLHYPLHLGVTESGDGIPGRLKSACAMASLLEEGLGDTLRVSLTEEPEKEIEFAKTMLDCFNNRQASQTPVFEYQARDIDSLLSQISFDWGPRLLQQGWKEEGLPQLRARVNGQQMSAKEMESLAEDLLQATRCRFSKNEYIACPGCGRTQYHLQEALAAVKAATAHLSGRTIAVMGCIVNGPGEMADADYGYVGEGGGKVCLYKGKEILRRHVPESEAPALLAQLIELYS